MKRPTLKVVEHGIAKDVEEKRIVFTSEEFATLLVPSMISFFNNAAYPDVHVDPNLGIEEITEEELPDGSLMCKASMLFHIRPHPDVFTNAGLVSKILAENICGNFPRQVSLVIHHTGTVMVVGLDIRSKKE